YLIRVQVAVRRAPEQLFHQLTHPRNSRRAAHQHGFVNVLWLQASIFQRLLDRADGAIDNGLNQLLKLRLRDLALVALAAGKFDVEHSLFVGGQLDLGFDHGLADGLHDLGIAANIHAEITLDVIERDDDEQIVNVVAAKVGVAVGGDHFEDPLVQLENGNVEGAAAEIVHSNGSVLLLVQTVGERGGGRLVHQAQDFQSRDAAGVFGGLPLRIVEVGGHGDDRFRHRCAKIALGVALQLAQDERRNFGRSECFVAQLDAQHFAGGEIFGEAKREELQFVLDVFNAAAHQALHAVDCALRRLDQILTCGAANNDLAAFVQRDDRRHQVQSVLAGNDDRTVARHIRHQRVGGAQIDPDDAFIRH